MATTKSASFKKWGGNAAKSFAFSSINVLKSVMPNMSSTVVSAQDTIRDTRNFISQTRSSLRSQERALSYTKIGRSARDIFKSAMEDIKSGNFSLEKSTDDLYDSYDDFGFSGFDESEEFDSTTTEPAEAALGKAMIATSAAQLDGMRTMTDVIARTQLKSAEMISQKSANIALFGINKLNDSLLGVHGRLDTINQNLVSMIQFQNENVSVTNQAMLQYFDRSLEILNKLDTNFNNLGKEDKYRRDKANPLRGDGFDFKEYSKMIKENFRNTTAGSLISMAKMMYSMESTMGGGIRLPKMVLENLLIPSLIPKDIKRNMEKLDKNVKSYMQNFLYRMGDMGNDYSRNAMERFIGEVLGMKRPTAKNINLGNFHKDAMGWNGIAQRTLVEVIPSYLASIEAKLTRNEERYYDVDEGIFKRKSQIEKDFYENESFDIQMNMRDSIDTLNDYLATKNLDENRIRELQDQINDLVHDRLTGDRTNNREYREEIKRNLDPYLSKDEFRDVITKLENGITEAIKSVNRSRKDIENDEHSGSVYRNLFNDGSSSKIKRINLFESNFSIDIAYEIESIANNLGVEDFRPSPSLVKEYLKASKDGASQSELEKIVRKGLGNRVAASRFDRFNPFRRFRNRTNRITDRVNRGIDAADNFMFDYMMGYNNLGGNNTNPSVGRASSRADSNNNTNRVRSSVSRYSNPDLRRQEERLSRFSYRDLTESRDMRDIEENIRTNQKIMETEKDLSARLSNVGRNSVPSNSQYRQYSAVIGASSRMTGREAELTNSNGMDESTSNSLKGTVINLYGAFMDTVTGLFGKDGFFKSFWKSEFIKDKAKKIKDKLFNEKDGIFKGVTVRFHDAADAIKYVFTGKEYTDSKGKKHARTDNSVFGHIKNGYNFIFSNTMKYFFGDDYQTNETFKKYFKWMDINKKKKPEDVKSGQASNISNNQKLLTDSNTNVKLLTDSAQVNSNLLMLPAPRTGDSSKAEVPVIDEEGNKKIEKIDSTDTSKIQSRLQNNLIVSTVKTADDIRKSGNNLTEVVFGNSEEKEETQKQSFLKRFRQNLPKMLTAGIAGAGLTMLTGGSLGLLGSLFLPGGPVGGAIVGMSLQLLSKSDKFKKFVFGEEDKDGKRTGGLISNRMQQAFKKSLPVIVGGATLGAMKHLLIGGMASNPFTAPLGIMAGALLPGGVVGGALLGMGVSLVSHNEKFRKILFGEKDEDTGKRAGGIFSRGMNVFNKAVGNVAKIGKGGLKGLGIGTISGLALSKMGILGSAVSLGGPVGMGLMGLGLGIASQTNRFQQYLFGTEEIGPDGKPTGKRLKNGLLHQVRNLLVVNIFDPVKQKISDEMTNFAYWAKDKIMFPFRKAFGPIEDALLGLKDSIGDYVKDKFDVLTDGIGNLFKATMKKIFSPFTKVMGKIGTLAIQGIGLSARAAGTLVAAPINLVSAITSPTRARNKIDFYKSYVKGNWNATDEEGNKRGLLGRISSVVSGFANEDTLNAARMGWEDSMQAAGKNHRLWMSVDRDRKANREEWKQAKEEQKKWAKIDKLRQQIVNEDKHEAVFWTQKRTQEISKKLKSYGLTEGVDREDDIKKLLFHKDDWKDQFVDKKVGLGNGFAETPEMAKARMKTSNFQDIVDDRLKDIYKVMFIMAQGTLSKSERRKLEKQKSRASKRFQNRLRRNIGIDPSELGYDFDPDEMDIPLYEFQNYRDSEEYASGDFKGWYEKNRRRWEDDSYEYERKDNNPRIDYNKEFTEFGFTDIDTLGHGNLTAKQLEAAYKVHSRRGASTDREDFARMMIGADYNEKIIDRLDSMNEALYGGSYDRKSRDKNIGKPISPAIVDRAHVSEEEIEETNKRSLGSIFKNIFKFKKKSDEKKAREEREARETEEATSLGAIITNNMESDESNETSSNKESTKGTKTEKKSLIGKIFDSVGGVFGSLANWFSKTSNWGKLAIAGGLGVLFKDQIGSMIDTVFPIITNQIIPGISNVLLKHGPQLIQKSVEIIGALAPALVEGAATLLSSFGSAIVHYVGGSLGISSGAQKDVTEEQAKTAQLFGNNVYTDPETGQIDIGGTRDIVDEEGNWNKIHSNASSRAGVYARNIYLTRKAANSGFVKKATRMVAKTAGIAVGGIMGMPMALGSGGLSMIVGSATGGKVGKVLGRAITGDVVEKAVAENADKGVRAAAEIAESSSQKGIRKFLKKAVQVLDGLKSNKTLIGAVKKFLPNKATILVEGFIDSFKKLITKANSGVDKMATKLWSKVSGKIVKNTAEDAAAGATLGVGAAVFGVYDLVSGAFEADRLFGVKSDEVNIIMRAISSLFKAVLGLPVVWVIDIVIEILSAVLNMDIKRAVATQVYGLVDGLSDFKVEDLQRAQTALEIEADNYNAKNNTNLSPMAYKEMVNKGALGRIKDFFTGNKRDYSQYEATEEQINAKLNGTYKKHTSSSIGFGNGQAAIGYSGSAMAQNDPRWANYTLGKLPNGKMSTMATGGCGPTALSMVASSVKKGNTDPLSIAKFAKAKGYITQGGSSAKLFTDGARQLGLRPSDVRKDSLDKTLQTGKPIILSGRGNGNVSETPFTKVGHIVTATGMDRNGNVLIKDPQYGTTRPYNIDKIKGGITHAWAYGNNKATGYGDVEVPKEVEELNQKMFPLGFGKLPYEFTEQMALYFTRKKDKFYSPVRSASDEVIIALYKQVNEKKLKFVDSSEKMLLETRIKDIMKNGKSSPKNTTAKVFVDNYNRGEARRLWKLYGNKTGGSSVDTYGPELPNLDNTTLNFEALRNNIKPDLLPYDQLTKHQGAVFYSVNDPLWKDLKYKTGTVQNRGQDLVSLAMLLSTMSGKGITPAYLLKNILPNLKNGAYDNTNGIRWSSIFNETYGIQNVEDVYGIDGKPIKITKERKKDNILGHLTNAFPTILRGYKFLGSLFGDGTGERQEELKVSNDKIGSVLATYSDLNNIAISNPESQLIDGLPLDNVQMANILEAMVGPNGKTPVLKDDAFIATLSDGTTPININDIEHNAGIQNMIQVNSANQNKGDRGILSILTDFIMRFVAIGTNAVESFIKGEKYSRVLNDDGSIVPGKEGLFQSLISSITGSSTSDGTIYADAPGLSGDKKTFIKMVLPGAINGQKKHNILSSLTLSQAALESGWGKSAIGHNIYGIKAGSAWTGATRTVPTKEFVNGQYVTVNAKFRDYPSFEASVEDHNKLLLSPRYDKVRQATNYRQATQAVKDAGYATDPNYPSKLNNIIESNNLHYYDNPDNFFKSLAMVSGTEENKKLVTSTQDVVFNTASRLFNNPALELASKANSLSSGYGRVIGYGAGTEANNIAQGAASVISNIADIGDALALAGLKGISYSQAKQELAAMKSSGSSSYTGTSSSSSGNYGQVSPATLALLNDKNNSVKNFFIKDLKARVSSDYGPRSGGHHNGIDFAAAGGTPIHTPVAGVVTVNKYEAGGFGNYIKIKDKIGNYHIFGHMNAPSPLAVGQKVGKGALVGNVGTTGASTGNHLHYEIRTTPYKGSSINPNKFDLNQVAEGYGSIIDSTIDNFDLGTSKKISKSMNINNTNSKPNNVIYLKDLGYGVGAGEANSAIEDAKKREITQKLNVNLNNKGVEEKLDIMIDIMKEWWNLDKSRPATSSTNNTTNVIGYGNGKSNKPIVINKQSDPPQYAGNSLRNVHERIAGGRR